MTMSSGIYICNPKRINGRNLPKPLISVDISDEGIESEENILGRFILENGEYFEYMNHILIFDKKDILKILGNFNIPLKNIKEIKKLKLNLLGLVYARFYDGF